MGATRNRSRDRKGLRATPTFDCHPGNRSLYGRGSDLPTERAKRANDAKFKNFGGFWFTWVRPVQPLPLRSRLGSSFLTRRVAGIGGAGESGVMTSVLGVREWVALGVLAVALGIGALFYAADGGDASIAPRTPVPPTPAPAPHAIAGESPWTVTFLAAGEPETVIGQSRVAALDFEYPGAPFLDVKDDAWRILAVTTFDGPAGHYDAVLTYEGEVSVRFDETEVQVSPAKGKGSLYLPIEKEEGKPVLIRVSVRDAGGPLVLKWQLAKRK